jgi:hypothetical protein
MAAIQNNAQTCGRSGSCVRAIAITHTAAIIPIVHSTERIDPFQ